MKRFLAFCAVAWWSSAVCAAAPEWHMVPEKSTLSFVATQSNAPVEVELTRFTAVIRFDAAKLEESSIHAEMDLTGMKSSYEEVAKQLIAPEWLDVAHYGKAVFDTTKIDRVPGTTNQFFAAGKLTLRGKTEPVDIQFELDDPNASDVVATGKATVRRTKFGVGQGEWAATDTVKDEVAVHFHIVAKRG